MRNYRRIALAALLGGAMALSSAIAQEADDDDDDAAEAPAAEAAAPAAGAEKPTRASKDVPELILGTKEDQFTANQKDFTLIAGQGYRWKITAAGGLEYKFQTDLNLVGDAHPTGGANVTVRFGQVSVRQRHLPAAGKDRFTQERG